MNLTQKLFAIVVVAGTVAFASTSVPGIVSVAKITPPAAGGFSVVDGVFTRSAPSANNLNGATGISLNQPQIWFERELAVPDIGAAGGTRVDWLGGTDSLGNTYAITASGGTGGAGFGTATAFNTTRVLAAGTLVRSYYLYSNRNNASVSGNNIYMATMVFSQPILGVIVNNQAGFDRLNATNAAFGRAGVFNYNSSASAGYDSNQNDRLLVQQISAVQYQLSFRLSNNGFDSLRILTATPEPATWAAFGLIAIALFVAARRHRASAARS